MALAETAIGQEKLVLQKEAVRDPMANNKNAAHVLVPEGWKLQGGVTWYPNHSHLANSEFRVVNPKGHEQVEYLPIKPYVWLIGSPVQFQTGANYLGSEVQKPVSHPRDYVAQFVLPSSRRGLDAKVVDYKELPELAKAVATGQNLRGCSVRAGKTRVEYRIGNQSVEEDIYVALGVLETNLGGMTIYNWAPDRVFAIRSAKGDLDRKANLLVSIANSVVVNPEWFAEYMQVVELFRMRVQNGIDNAAALSRHLASNAEQIRRMSSESYAYRQKVQDKVNAQFSDYIRGVTRYDSPHHSYPVQAPSGYDHVWSNASGQVILSNSGNFNPSASHGGTWTELKPAK